MNVKCKHCGRTHPIRNGHAKRVKCPSCGNELQLPAQRQGPPPLPRKVAVTHENTLSSIAKVPEYREQLEALFGGSFAFGGTRIGSMQMQACVGESPHVEAHSQPMDGQGAIPEFFVTETESQRFHFAGFGVAIGGQHRDTPFVIIVKDRHGRAIARSKPVTAAGLRIAAGERRGDYDKNGYRQSDFIKRDETGTP